MDEIREHSNIAIIFAGGVGQRMSASGMPKQFLKVNGVPIIVHTLQVFQDCVDIDRIVVACVSDYLQYMRKLVKTYKLDKVSNIVVGGKTTQQSIYNALAEADKEGNPKDIVLIHDGVRPLIDEALLIRNIESVQQYGSAISSVLSKETVVVKNEDCLNVTDRSNTYLARAPQSFYLGDILDCHIAARKDGKEFIDCCTMMLHYGKQLHIVGTSYQNIKITTPDDFYIFKALLSAKENAQALGLVL